MTNKIDHAAEALSALAAFSEEGYAHDVGYRKQELLTEAQVHATLALAEQQRIATLVALNIHHEAIHAPGAFDALYFNAQTDIDARSPIWKVRPEIVAALGLDS